MARVTVKNLKDTINSINKGLADRGSKKQLRYGTRLPPLGLAKIYTSNHGYHALDVAEIGGDWSLTSVLVSRLTTSQVMLILKGFMTALEWTESKTAITQ